MAGQSNLSPGDAANIWKQYIQPLHAQGVRLGAPAVSSAPAGPEWLASFMSACTGCTFDFVPLHWYGDGSQFFEQYVRDFHSRFNYPLWVTEWASTSSDPNGELLFAGNLKLSDISKQSPFSSSRIRRLSLTRLPSLNATRGSHLSATPALINLVS
jgi:hypothetical protein